MDLDEPGHPTVTQPRGHKLHGASVWTADLRHRHRHGGRRPLRVLRRHAPGLRQVHHPEGRAVIRRWRCIGGRRSRDPGACGGLMLSRAAEEGVGRADGDSVCDEVARTVMLRAACREGSRGMMRSVAGSAARAAVGGWRCMSGGGGGGEAPGRTGPGSMTAAGVEPMAARQGASARCWPAGRGALWNRWA